MNPIQDMGAYGMGVGLPLGVAPLIAILVLWSVVWKGLALWHSANRGDKWWFIAILVINSVGILEIIYLFGIARMKFSELFSGFAKKEETVVVDEPGA